MNLSQQEKDFLSSIEKKIIKYDIKVSLSDCVKVMSNIQVFTNYNDDSVELVDSSIEIYLIKNSFSYFLNRYARVDIPGLGTIFMEPYYFQSEMAKEIQNYRKLVLDKTRQCLTENNYVMTNRGYISIKDIKPGDMIETIIDDKSTFVLVEDFYNQGIKEVCRILTNSGLELKCTLDHKIMTKKGWKEAKDLSLSDEVISLINKSQFGNFKLDDDNHAALIGYYFADGRSGQPSFTNTNIDYINEVLEIGKTFENCYPYIFERPEDEIRKKGYDVRLSSRNKNTKLNRPILDFMKKHNLRKKSNDRILTNDLMNLNKKQMSILLNRLFAGDGYITYRKDNRRPNYIQYEIGLGAPNYTFIKQLEYILQTKYGIHCQINEMFDKRYTQRFWKIRIQQKKSVISFIKEIGIKGKTDTKEIIDLISSEKPYNSNQSFEKIRKIEKLNHKETVYDITTSTNDFISNGLLVHNCGISTVFALYAFWKTHFFPAEMIDVVSVKQLKAQQFVKKIYSTMESLPVWMKTPIKSQNQQKIVFQHAGGTTSEILSESQSENAGRGDSLSVLILDEVAFYQSDRMVRQIIASAQPTLNKTGGQIVLISCLTNDTYIFTENGMQQIKDYIPKDCKLGYNNIPEFKIDGMKLQQRCNTLYDSGITPTIKITTNSGIELEGSYIHPLMVIENGRLKFKQLQELTNDDVLVIKKGNKSFGDYRKINFKFKKEVHNGNDLEVIEIDELLAYVFGLYLAEGYIYCDNKKHYKLQLAVTEQDIKNKIEEFAKKYNLHITKQKTQYTISSKGLIKLFEDVGFDITRRSRTKEIPANLLRMPEELMKHMIIGMFDGDGCNNIKSNTIDYTSYSNKMLKQIHLLLNNFGVFSKLDKNNNKLSITKDREIFLKEIGFNLKRKQNIEIKSKETWYPIFDFLNSLVNKYSLNRKKLQKKGCDLYLRERSKNKSNKKLTKESINVFIEENRDLPETKEIQFLIENNLDFDYIVNFEYKEAHTYDFTIPETKSFIANGIVSSNTPSGTSGRGAYYYEQVVAARSGEKGTRYLEIDWWEIPDDSKIQGPKKGYNSILEKAIKENYYYKERVKQKYQIFFEPISRDSYNDNDWLRAAFQDLGDSTYRQEILHDFIVAGDKVFNEDILKEVELAIVEPIRKDKFGSEQIEGWWVWKDPVPGHRYIIGVDISTGTGSDYSSLEVIDVAEYEQVAEYKGFISTPNFVRLIRKVANWYNEAYIIVESNSIGESIFNGLYYSENEPYNNMFKQKKTKNNVTRFTGWITDIKSRKLIVNDFIDWITVPDLWNQIKIYSKRIWLEMSTWIWSGGNKAEHSQGCVSSDTIITCENGFKEIKDIVIGDKVLTHTGEFKSVYKTFKFKDESKKMLVVKSWGNEVLNITSNQEFYINDGEFRNFDDIYNFKGIKLNSIYSKRIYEYKGNKDELFLFFIGHVLADGTISNKNCITITSENKESIIVFEKYKEYFKDKVENCYISEYPKEQFRRFTIRDKNLYKELKEIGVSKNKTIPLSLRYIDPILQKNILMGYLFGDGCFSIDRTGSIVANSISYNLSYFISSILYRNNISFNINRTKVHRYEKNNNDQWSISILGKECLKIFENILFNDIFYLKNNYVETSKFINTKPGIKTSKLRNYYGDLLQSNIHSVNRIHWDNDYYDLSVEDNHSYVANGYIVHNSHDDSIMAFAIAIYNRNKAVVSGDSFIINPDGSTTGSDDNTSNIKVLEGSKFEFIESKEEEETDYKEKYGVDKEEYAWLIK